MSAAEYLATVKARIAKDEADYGTGHEWEPSIIDRRALVAALAAVTALADRAEVAEESSFGGPKGSIGEWERGFNEGKSAIAEAITSAITEALGATE